MNMRIKLCLLLFCFCYVMQSANAANKPLVLGIHPYKTPSKLIKAFTPLAQYISEQINMPIEVHISKDYQTHIDNIGNKKINIGYLGPASYIKLTRQYGKKPILAQLEINGKPTFQGKIIVRKDSPFHTLADLKNKLFAFGDPNSTMSHLVPRFMLSEAGIKIPSMLKHKFLGSHDNVALGVLTGD
jgi:phosphonate transport system substrate-binding protein